MTEEDISNLASLTIRELLKVEAFLKAVTIVVKKRMEEKGLTEVTCICNKGTIKNIIRSKGHRPSYRPSSLRRFAETDLGLELDTIQQRAIDILIQEHEKQNEQQDEKQASTISSPSQLYYWAPHSVHLLIQAVFEKGPEHGESRGELLLRVKILLEIDDNNMFAIMRGFRPGPKIAYDCIRRFVNKTDILRPEDLDSFLVQAPNLLGWRNQIRIAKYQHANPLTRTLIEILQQKIVYAEEQWLAPIREKICKVNPLDKGYLVHLQDIYFGTQINLGSDDMLVAAKADFSNVNRWDMVLEDPESSSSHLNYSNIRIGDRLSKLLTDPNLSRKKTCRHQVREFNILEGGVGGGHTAYWLIKQLVAKIAKENSSDWSIRYLGFEVVPDSAFLMNQLLSSNPIQLAENDSRRALYQKTRHLLHPLLPEIYGQDCFVDNCPMELGILGLTKLRKDDGSPLLYGQLDAFVTAYAFHHVPNGLAIRKYLKGDDNRGQYLTLEKHNRYLERSKFLNRIIQSCERIYRAFLDGDETARFTELRSLKHGPARVFISLFDPRALHNGQLYQDFMYFLRELPRFRWRFPEEILSCLRNPQAELLENVYKLLRPGGLVVIADPDGTSSFNAEKIAQDPEISIANFRNIYEIQDLLRDPSGDDRPRQNLLYRAGFKIVKAVTVKRDQNGEYSETEQPPAAGLVLPGTADDNLGYIVIARKPLNVN